MGAPPFWLQVQLFAVPLTRSPPSACAHFEARPHGLGPSFAATLVSDPDFFEPGSRVALPPPMVRSFVLEKENPNSYFHELNLQSVVTTLFTAGTDTSSGTLRWGFLLMMKYPDVQRKVQEEIERVIGSEQPNMGHRKLMPYTDAVIHEVLRFGTIVPLSLPRETTVDTNFKGYFIPKGTYVIPLLESVLYDKSQFEKPDEFNPQHFLDSEGRFLKKDALMIFGAGQRLCIGENLAKMELFIFFTSLMQRFSFQLPPGVTHIDLTPAVGFTTPPSPYEICAVHRA